VPHQAFSSQLKKTCGTALSAVIFLCPSSVAQKACLLRLTQKGFPLQSLTLNKQKPAFDKTGAHYVLQALLLLNDKLSGPFIINYA
jgi:hypothetical protein